ncbi:MAG: NTP transferase domain-containing protein [Gammaproteobacteria bacterium]|nr:NTP transferase domain-containing protein [Gammaproteobacteria bacterium]MCP4089757.1 NTP transferase domain-containing protein [Gammaproteobacteria bacterium]MCP4278226.1 NTP transferase domain-containing protein [Gammaproteobacteria bacterium]MCP4831945.1 NTP transferase domain-containing protein [Gammaproteobacteria bacterium]MCP4927583.1 NTP transferase domain-containing protein [Gammaproteobacteria bacterium]
MSSQAPLLGLVLAGGQSRRMGADKAALEIAGASMLSRAVAMLELIIDQVYVSVNADQSDDPFRTEYSVISDRFSDIGPAAGLLSAHLYSPESAWLVIACDMPLLTAATLLHLRDSRKSEMAATVWAAEDSSGPEPLCAIYEPGTLAAFLEQVTAGGNPSPRDWLLAAQVNVLAAPNQGVLNSANTPEEFATMTENLNAPVGATDKK